MSTRRRNITATTATATSRDTSSATWDTRRISARRCTRGTTFYEDICLLDDVGSGLMRYVYKSPKPFESSQSDGCRLQNRPLYISSYFGRKFPKRAISYGPTDLHHQNTSVDAYQCYRCIDADAFTQLGCCGLYLYHLWEYFHEWIF